MLVKITLPDGTAVEGERDEVRRLMEDLGKVEKGIPYYYSKSRGLMRVSKMETPHLKNALLKIYREWVSDLGSETDPQVICKKIISGPDDENFVKLYRELTNRTR